MAFGVRSLGRAPVRRRPAAPIGPWARTGAAAVHAQPTTPRGPSPWAPPPLPSGSYDPSRDIASEESERGLGQLEGNIGTKRARDTTDYYTARQGLETQAQQQASDYQRAQEQLRQSFQRLGTTQTERANAAGGLSSGALLQAAAKRAANEGQQAAVQNTAFQRQQQANQLARARLDLLAAPPDTANPLGGREFQDLLSELTNAQANNTFYTTSERKLAGQEAAERGYVAPSAPRAPAKRAGTPHARRRASEAAFKRALGRRF